MTPRRKDDPPKDELIKPDKSGNRVRILVVEDDVDLAESLCMLLDSYGYEAFSAADGMAALEQLKDGHLPDIILLDLMLPRLDGWEFRDAQLADKHLRDIPVVVLSAAGDLIKPIEADCVLRKPVHPGRLVETIERFRHR